MKHKRDQTFAPGEDVLIWAAVSTKAQDRYSVEDQLRLMRAWCAERHVNIVDELVVRGFSRDYWTLADVVAAAGDDKDMAAFAELQKHIRRRAFTLFLCFDADRFGRTTSLVHEVIGRITRDCQARILTLFDNTLIDVNNAPMIGTLKALKAQQDIDKLKEYRERGMHNRARDGKSTATTLPLFQKRIRDERGREAAVVVNEDLRPLYTDLATVILRGVAWDHVEEVLFDEFGHGIDGKPYPRTAWRRYVMNPSWWGHAAINWHSRHGRSTVRSEPWIWDESVEPPEPITVYRNMQPAVYSGEWADLGAQVREELWRRHRLNGRAFSFNTHRFSRLLVCNECGYALAVQTGGSGRKFLRCETRYRERTRGMSCSNTTYVRPEYITEWFHARLEAKIAGMPSDLLTEVDGAVDLSARIADEERRLARLTQRLDSLIAEMVDAPEIARPVYRRQIEETSRSIERARSAVETLRGQELSSLELVTSQARLIHLLRENGVDWLWTQPETFIHQQLTIALAHQQLVISRGEIIGTHPVVKTKFRD